MNIKIYSKKIFTESFYKFIKLIGTPIVMNKFSPIILNKENIPNKKPIVYAPNHRKTLDPFFIVLSSPDSIHWAALKRFFTAEDSIFNNSKNPVLCKTTSLLFRGIGAVPVDRGGDNSESIKKLNEYLEYNSCIGIFPEGTTNKKPKETDVLPIKSGVIHFAKDNNAWLQPISIVWIPKELKVKNRLIINYREPFKISDMDVNDAINLWISKISTGIKENEEIINNLSNIKNLNSVENKTLKLNIK